MRARRVVVGFSGGVTSAWAGMWALRNFPREEVVWLFHDTQAEDADTYRFIREFSEKAGFPVTERSDGRSVEQVEDDEEALANNRMAFCSRILKAEQRDLFFLNLRELGVEDIVNVLGFTQREWQRIQRATVRAEAGGYGVRFPLVEDRISKQEAADFCMAMGVRPPAMYEWSDHANCPGCRRGGRAYWLAVKANRPEVFQRAVEREEQFGHTIINGTTLVQLAATGLKRSVARREAIEINCECGG